MTGLPRVSGTAALPATRPNRALSPRNPFGGTRFYVLASHEEAAVASSLFVVAQLTLQL